MNLFEEAVVGKTDIWADVNKKIKFEKADVSFRRGSCGNNR